MVTREDGEENSVETRHGGIYWLLLLLLVIPYIGTLWVATYARFTPTLGGIPFFYWYQFLWIIIGSVLTAIVYFLERGRGEI